MIILYKCTCTCTVVDNIVILHFMVDGFCQLYITYMYMYIEINFSCYNNYM